MKKIIKIILCICLLPLDVLACPHIDAGGSAHLQTYNEDYTEVNMIYPKDSYLYVKNVTMTVQDYLAIANENELLDETFSFPVVQDYEDYLTYYWFLDESLIGGDESKVDITVENIDSLEVSSTSYKLSVKFPNTYTNGLEYITSYTEQIYYDVKINNATEAKKDYIISNDLVLASNEIYDVSARYTIIENNNYNYSTTYENIKSFHDEIIMSVTGFGDISNIAAINLNKSLTSNNYIEVNMNDGMYSFKINEPGIYTLIEKKLPEITEDTIIEEHTEESEETENSVNNKPSEIVSSSKEEGSSNFYIIVVVSASILIGLIYFAIKS